MGFLMIVIAQKTWDPLPKVLQLHKLHSNWEPWIFSVPLHAQNNEKHLRILISSVSTIPK